MGQDDNHWCELGFAEQDVVFKGPTRNARVRTEGWVAAHLFCPSCGAEEFELKVRNGRLGAP
jgi:hypothetical protein